MAGYLDFTLGEPGVDWRITVGGVDVSDIVADGSQAEWSLFQLNSPAPIIQIGSINLEAAELSPVSIDLRGIQPDTLVQGFWRGTLQWSARVLQNEITSWDRFGDNVQAVTLRLTDRLGQALASNDLVNPIWINSGFIMPWYDYAAAQIRSRGNVAVNTSGLESLQGSGENDGYSYPQDSGDNPVLFAAGVAACRGFALWCDPNEVVQFLRYPDIPAPSRRYSRDQVDEFEPDFAVEPPAKEVTVSGDFTREKRVDLGDVRRTAEIEYGEIPENALTSLRGNIDVRRVFTTVFPFDRTRSSQRTIRTVIARQFALPGSDARDIRALTWVQQEETVTTTIFRRPNTIAAGFLDRIRIDRTVNRKAYIPNGPSSDVILPDDVERWVYDANGVPIEHIIEKGDAIRDTVNPDRVLTFISERVIERFRKINDRQAEMYRAVYRADLDNRGFFNPALRIVESKTEPIDQIPSPPAQPETRELETVTFVRRAAIEGGTGQSVDVTVPGISVLSAQTFCNFYALVEGRRRNPIVVSRPLEPNESIRPLDREDIHNKALIRDGISVQYNPSEGSAVLSYSGWLAGTFSPPVQIPPRKPPSGNLSGILTIQPLDPFTTVQGFAIAPIRLDAFGGTPPYVFGAPSLPTGLTISGSNIIGTPTVAFDGLVTVTVTDAAMDTSQFEWDLTVTATLPILDPTVQLVLANEYVLTTFGLVGAPEAKERPQTFILNTFALIGPLLQVWEPQFYVMKTFGRVLPNPTVYVMRTFGRQVLAEALDFYIFVIGGGGSGGGGKVGGGGGGGQYLDNGGVSLRLTNGSYSVIIGAGGAPTSTTGVDGSPSQFGASLIAAGGGGGGTFPDGAGRTGASGGGGSNNGTGGTATAGNIGGNGGVETLDARLAAGGGGGSETPGQNGNANFLGTGGRGGRGIVNSFGTGDDLRWGSGGGGGGGTSGGGTGGFFASDGVGGSPFDPPTAGTANTGGGGGGSGDTSSGTEFGAAGGSGVVFIYYFAPPCATGGTIYESGGVTYHRFDTSGTFTVEL